MKLAPELHKPSSGTGERSCADLPHMRDVSAAENTSPRNKPSKCVLKQAVLCFYAALQLGPCFGILLWLGITISVVTPKLQH